MSPVSARRPAAPTQPVVMRPREAVYATLKRRILLNDLKPGTALTELGLAQDLACSQGTVREALLRLQEDGLVLRAGHRGTSVTPLDPEEADEILALRRRLERRGALRAAQSATPAQRQETLELISGLQDAMDQAATANDTALMIELDTAFHMAIFRLAGLRALEQILLRCILHSHRQKLWEPRHNRPLDKTARRHRPIIAALADCTQHTGGEELAAALAHHIDTIVDVSPPATAQETRTIENNQSKTGERP